MSSWSLALSPMASHSGEWLQFCKNKVLFFVSWESSLIFCFFDTPGWRHKKFI